MAKTRNSGTNTPAQQSRAKREEIAAALASAAELQRFNKPLAFERHERKRRAKPARIIAYDFETTRIAVGTPRPLYLTAFEKGWALEVTIKSMAHLTKVLKEQFLTADREGTKYVAWNSNRFDAYFIAAALIREDEYILKPYMTKSKTLRGLRVIQKYNDRGFELDPKHAPSWEFLDGIAMLGLAGVSLEKFLANFAPEFPKHAESIDFEREEFDPKNKKHRAYALRDSEGLYHAMTRAQQIMLDTFNEPLAVTMGGVCIKIFQAHIPRDVTVFPLIPDLEAITRRFIVRGGFCYCVRRYQGPVWKYDINQAYAAAMRDADLPCGHAVHIKGNPRAVEHLPFVARIKAHKSGNAVPFYYRTEIEGRLKTLFSGDTIAETWVTSIEYRQLQVEGWAIHCSEFYVWPRGFSMREYVDKLETLRMNAEGGPSGPIGTMVKATGNHSYGKTLEDISPIEYLLALECPDDALPFYDNGFDELEHVFYRIDTERKKKPYHQPQLGAFITAHVRMVLRRAVLLNPVAWLYADTDCIVFSEDMTSELDIHARRYGAWKIEEEGTEFRIIAKKVYSNMDATKRSAKGMNVRKLSADDFARWFEGDEPTQNQIQLNNFLAVLVGADMFRAQERSGTRIEAKTAA